MLWLVSQLKGAGIQATDGPVGSIDDLLLDDRQLVTRWVVVDTGGWLPGRQVLLPPSCFGQPEGTPKRFPVELTKDKVKDSPDVYTDAPVSRQMEASLYGYYGWVPYWSGPLGYAPVGYGLGPSPIGYAPPYAGEGAPGTDPTGSLAEQEEVRGDPHLRSAREVIGYHIQAEDGDIGHVEDLMIEDQSWAVRYLIVDTKNWWPGKKVLVAPQWVGEFSWADRRVDIDLTRQQIKDAPEYEPGVLVERDYEDRLHRHYDRPPYWT